MRARKPVLPPVVQDTREQEPFLFGPEVATQTGTLPSGDYSLLGFELRVAIERKSLADFVASVTRERERFWRELERLRSYEFAAVVVEGSVEELLAGAYISQARPWSVLASALAVMHDFGFPVVFAGDRTNAARCTLWFLRRFFEKHVALELMQGAA